MKKLLISSQTDHNWLKYCGFMDLTMEQFMSIQESLLRQQMETFRRTSLWRKIAGESLPRNMTEFRRMVPLTRYEDYLPELQSGETNALYQKPLTWTKSSGAGCQQKMVPVTDTAYQKQLEHLMAVFILACSQSKGQSTISQGDRISISAASGHSLPGVLAEGAAQAFKMQPVVLSHNSDTVEFRKKTLNGFEAYSGSGMDIVVAAPGDLVRTGREFDAQFRQGTFAKPLDSLNGIYRFIRAGLTSRYSKKPVLPRDIWPLKALICWGLDTDSYREQLYQYWGTYPFQFYACTEAGVIAVQSWRRAGMTFIPDSNFFEFLPEEELAKAAEDNGYEPRTVLLNEVKPGERYELVMTSFYGMPFLRYRPGHLIRITAIGDSQAGIALPQMVFESRADDLIDVTGITRVSQNSICRALAAANVIIEDWVARREVHQGNPFLHIYLETRGNTQENLESLVESQLSTLDAGFHEFSTTRPYDTLRVTLLHPGSFKRYSQIKQTEGASSARQRPRRMNTSEEEIRELMGQKIPVPAAST